MKENRINMERSMKEQMETIHGVLKNAKPRKNLMTRFIDYASTMNGTIVVILCVLLLMLIALCCAESVEKHKYHNDFQNAEDYIWRLENAYIDEFGESNFIDVFADTEEYQRYYYGED